MADKQRCPRRDESPNPQAYGGDEEFPDRWTPGRFADLHCSYCGSLHPDRFMEYARAREELGPTDKSYKVYLTSVNHDKFYFQHLSPEQRAEFVRLMNDQALNVGVPGHFYTLPFFAKVNPAG